MDHLSEKKTLGSLSLWKDPTEMFVNFIYYRMLVDVAIFHGIIKKGSSTHWRHALFTCYKDRGAFDVPNSAPLVHSLSLLFIYLLRFFFLIYFLHFCFSCHNRSYWWKVVNITKTLKGIWIFITGDDFRARQAVSSERNSEKITAIFTLMITFKLISISWRDVG